MKHLKLFNDIASHEAYKNSEDYVLPNVSYVEENKIVIYEPSVDLTANYLTIEALEDGLTASLSTNACQYCIDGDGNWIDLPAGTATQAINSGQTLSFRGRSTPALYMGVGQFIIDKKCNLMGNCNSLLFGDDTTGNNDLSGKNYAFKNLFKDCTTIIQVSETFLPATTLADSCYNYMFNGCTSLTTAPELPATTLASSCYNSMFEGCTSLTTAPELPATKLAKGCYFRMLYGTNVLPDFSNIDFTSNTVVSSGLDGLFAGTKVTDNDLYNILPINPSTGKYWLPATTLTDFCYSSMFEGCTSLTTAPELPATTLADSCYNHMFNGCTSLTTAPELPATKLAKGCYYFMFNGCTSLTTAPELPATTLVKSCYFRMFSNCSNLSYIKMLATNISATGCLNYWVERISSTGTFIKNPSMTSLPTGKDGIPNGWTVQNA
jgi:hypothetical protein